MIKTFSFTFLLFLCLIILPCISFSQNKYIDSLRKVLQNEKEDTNKVNTLNLLSFYYNQKADYTNTEQNANKALSLSVKINFKSGMGESIFNLGSAYGILKNYAGQMDYYNKALRIYKEINDLQSIIQIYDYISGIYSDQNNYAEALKNKYDCQKFREQTGDKNTIAYGLYGIGLTYTELKNDSEALKNFHAALKIFKETNNKTYIGVCYFNIGDFDSRHGNFPEALNRFFDALAIAESEKNLYGVAYAYSAIGELYEKQGELAYRKGEGSEATDKYHEAEKNMLISLKKYQSLSSQASIASVFLELGIINIKLNKLLKARKLIDSSLSISESIQYKQLLMDDYQNLSTLDSLSKNYKDAYQYFKKSILYRDSINLEENAKKSVQIQMQYDFDKKESMAKAEQDKKDIEGKRIKNQQYLIITTLGVLILAVIIIAFIQFRNNKQKQKANHLLEMQKQKVETTLAELKSTQSQLIQSEKMASLGELTAGIAHEIQNPLNFVNNFSEVNKELVDELQSELKSGNTEEAIAISNDIKDNEEKINHHGKRADAIVKGMLQHSRSSTGQKELVNINAIADECLKLSYHSIRSKDKSFQANLKTDLDESIDKIPLVQQDIVRVLINLFNNAFYAVNEKSKQQIDGYEPTVSVSTKKINDKVILTVMDNGNGIPQKVIDKIFQPFFTTKPTGQGTGLGLSLSYDIIKAHGGKLKVETKEGEYAEFIIQLQISA